MPIQNSTKHVVASAATIPRNLVIGNAVTGGCIITSSGSSSSGMYINTNPYLAQPPPSDGCIIC